jgi:hypothetical protein
MLVYGPQQNSVGLIDSFNFGARSQAHPSPQRFR